MKFILNCLVTAVAVAAAVWIVPGIDVSAAGGTEPWVAIFIMALFLAVLNASIKPILHVLSLPISVLTLGIFALVVNTFVLYLASWLANGLFQVDFVASIVISIVSAIVGAITGVND